MEISIKNIFLAKEEMPKTHRSTNVQGSSESPILKYGLKGGWQPNAKEIKYKSPSNAIAHGDRSNNKDG